jgi:hypothetical protein
MKVKRENTNKWQVLDFVDLLEKRKSHAIVPFDP